MYRRRLTGENENHTCPHVWSHDGPNPLPKMCTNSKKVQIAEINNILSIFTLDVLVYM